MDEHCTGHALQGCWFVGRPGNLNIVVHAGGVAGAKLYRTAEPARPSGASLGGPAGAD